MGSFGAYPLSRSTSATSSPPIRNDFIIDRNELRRDAHLGTPSAARKRSLRAQRRKSLATAQQRFQKLATNHDLNHFFKHASELIENQQFRTAIVQVAAMIGISLVGGAIAGLAARGVGGVMLEATGAETVSELGMTARAGIAATRIGVDTTISSAGTVAVQGGSFSEVWKENLITSLASSAVFGSISRYATEQAELEGRIATTWRSASKLGKLGLIGKEVGALTAHTLWGAVMGDIAGRIVTGKAQPPPETLRGWALQAISVTVGKHIAHVLTTRSRLYQHLEQSAEGAGRGLVATARKLRGMARRVIRGKEPKLTVELLNEHDKFMRRQDRGDANTRSRRPAIRREKLAAARDQLGAAAEAAGQFGMLETKFTLIGDGGARPGRTLERDQQTDPRGDRAGR